MPPPPELLELPELPDELEVLGAPDELEDEDEDEDVDVVPQGALSGWTPGSESDSGGAGVDGPVAPPPAGGAPVAPPPVDGAPLLVPPVPLDSVGQLELVDEVDPPSLDEHAVIAAVTPASTVTKSRRDEAEEEDDIANTSVKKRWTRTDDARSCASSRHHPSQEPSQM